MFENIMKFFKNLGKKEKVKESSDTAKERLHLVLMQDRANVSADFLEMMKQEIIEVIKKYIDIDEKAIDVHLTNKTNDDGTVGAPALYANIPIVTIKNEARVANVPHEKVEKKEENKKEETVEDNNETNEQSEKVLEEAKKIQSEMEEEQNKQGKVNVVEKAEENLKSKKENTEGAEAKKEEEEEHKIKKETKKEDKENSETIRETKMKKNKS